MDQIKIGKYLSEKRRNLGLTQAQLAEKLNMSDKSVSKWERGVCLPDVSLYQELCSILGISVNEFLAGEDISSENLEKKAEDTIIQVAEDSKHRQKHLKRVAGVFIAVAIIALGALVAVLSLSRGNRYPRNYCMQVHESSVDMYTMLSGENAYLYKFSIPDSYNSLEICCREYHHGELVSESMIAGLGGDVGIGPHEAGFVIVYNPVERNIRYVVETAGGSSTAERDILDDVDKYTALTYSYLPMRQPVAVSFGNEQSLGALVFGKNMVSVPELADLDQEDPQCMDMLLGNDYVVYFSFIAEA